MAQGKECKTLIDEGKPTMKGPDSTPLRKLKQQP
jgi:hypothetical protein